MSPTTTTFFFMIVSVILTLSQQALPVDDQNSFTLNGFHKDNLTVDGCASVDPTGLLRLTTPTPRCAGHAFYASPLRFRPNPKAELFSFSTTFVISMVPNVSIPTGSQGLALVLSKSNRLPLGQEPWYLGVFNSSTNGSTANHIVSVEFDEFNQDKVGVFLNGHNPVRGKTIASFYDGKFHNLTFNGDSLQVWVDYDSKATEMNVTISPLNQASNMSQPFLSTKVNLSDVVLENMYVGFSGSVSSIPTSHYIRGWSFQLNGRSQKLDLQNLPPIPTTKIATQTKPPLLTIILPFATIAVLILVIVCAVLVVRRRRKFAEVLEDWEKEYGPHRFSYRDLFVATDGFKDNRLLGSGGFGLVYRGVLPRTKEVVAVKRVSHDSRQGMREFVAEIASVGRLRHRNLVQLLGYCRRKGELLLVYDYMPNGSLDKVLFENKDKAMLDWNQRLSIIRGVASGLLYLHEGWEQVVIHRDVKASNVLLDEDFTARLGDFGLARLYDHGSNPQTTHVVGTMGYIAPELTRTGKATTSTDVYAFGIFVVEVASGRRPIEPRSPSDEIITVDWVLKNWVMGDLLKSSDSRLEGGFDKSEMELVLRLGLLCAHQSECARPNMRQVMQYLDGDMCLPELSPEYWNANSLFMDKTKSFDEYVGLTVSSSSGTVTTSSLYVAGGR